MWWLNLNGIIKMLQFVKGNILEANAEALVNTVNTVGVMGKGIALAFKKAFPENYRVYKEACDREDLTIGKLLVTQTDRLNPRYIINFPTKKHWRNKSHPEYIQRGLKELVNTIRENKIQSIAIPPLGCGNGGLEWEEIKPLIQNELQLLSQETDILLYEPGYNNQNLVQKKEVTLTPARAMLLTALNNYTVLGYSIYLLVTQKLAYFLQRFGEPLNLEFEKGYYGPYAHRLQHLLKYLNGYFLRFSHEQTTPGTKVTLHHFEQVEKYSRNGLTEEQKQRLEQTNKLIEGFESPYGLELLATVDFVRTMGGLNDPEQIAGEIGSWTTRKKDLMKPYHIKVALQRLDEFYQNKLL